MRKLNLMALLAICLSICAQAKAQPLKKSFVNHKTPNELPAILTSSNAQFGTIQWFNANRINSRNRETSPVFLKESIVFMSTRNLPSSLRHKKSVKGDNYFAAKLKSGGKIRSLNPLTGEINKYKKNGPVSFSPTGLSIFFSRQATSQSGNTIYKISYAQKSGKAWKKVKDLPINDLEASSIHPFLAPDATRMYFASDRLGGYGGMDIYVSYYKKGHWTVPINLGPSVNSEMDEVYPVLASNGILYFASNKKGGHGGLDLYKAIKTTDEHIDKYYQVDNLGSPFNSTYDDFGILIDKNKMGGFFTSNRPGGEGQEDIYRWDIQIPSDNQSVIDQKELIVDTKKINEKLINRKPTALVINSTQSIPKLHPKSSKIVLKEDLTQVNKLDKAEKTKNFTYKAGQKITLSNLSINKPNFDDYAKSELNFISNILKKNPGMTIGFQHPTTYQNTTSIKDYLSEQGIEANRIEFEKLNSAIKNVTIEIAKMDHNYFNEIITAPEDDISIPTDQSPVSKRLPIATRLFAMSSYNSLLEEKLMLGRNAKLTKVHYDYNEYLLNDEAKTELDRVAGLMQQYQSIEISVQSHTDASGSRLYNEKLSARRSYAARDYLLSKGISEKRIKLEYFGEQKLIFQCKTSETCSEEGQRLNRRTEIKITNINTEELTHKKLIINNL